MYVIGLTGGIASGKSSAARTLRLLGAEVIDADEISRELTAPDGEAAPAILKRFGTLDRRALGGIVFSDEAERQALNAIVHPMVYDRLMDAVRASTAPVVVLDVPLLYETGMEALADEVWVVHVPRGEQIRRIVERDGLTEAEAIARIESQMPTEEKLRRADKAIDTSGSFAQTRAYIEGLWNATLAKVGGGDGEAIMPRYARRRRSQARQAQQRALEAQVSTPLLSHTRPFEPPPKDAWEDTSTLLAAPEQRTFLSRQPPVFWIVAGLLLVVMLTMVGIIGVNAWKEAEARRAEEIRLAQLAEEKARYRLVYRDLIDEYAQRQSIAPAFVAAVIHTESRFDPEAVSRLGARGLMQIMEDTGGWIAEKLDEENGYSFDLMFDPETNIRFGTWYLGYLARLFEGDLVKVAAGYHAGQNAVAQWLENPEYSPDGKTLKTIPYPGTEEYVERVKTAYEMYNKHYYAPEEDSAA